jgi:phage terminase large subunit
VAKQSRSSKTRLVNKIKETTKLEFASPQQQTAFEYGPYPLCLSGGYGSAKTWVACMKILFLADMFPGSRWVIARRLWTELQKTTMQTFFKLCPPQIYQPYGRRSDTEKILRLNNGSTIYWMHLDDPEIATIIQGIEINGFFIDQCEEVDEEIFEKLTSRIGRWDMVDMPDWLIDQHPGWVWRNQDKDDGTQGDPIVPPFAIIACNPDNELHWVYKRFHEDSPEKYESQGNDLETGDPVPSYAEQGYKMLHMPSDSNKFLSQVSLNQLKNKDEQFQRRYRRGEWGIPEGQIHHVDNKSIIPGDVAFLEKLLRRSNIFMTMDYGDSAPNPVTWWAVDPHQNVFAFQEYYEGCLGIGKHRENVTSWMKVPLGDGSEIFLEPLRRLADPTIFDKQTGKSGEKWSVAEEWADSVLYPPQTSIWWEAADNNEMSTRERINQYLRVDPNRTHPYTGEKGSPQLFFIQKSSAWPRGIDLVLRQTTSQRRKKVGMVMGKSIFSDERDPKITDHGYDTLRYFIATRTMGPKEASKQLHPRSFKAIQKEIKNSKRMAASQRIKRDNFLNAKVRSMRHG